MNDGYEEILVKRGKTPSQAFLKAVVISLVAALIGVGILFFNAIFLAAGLALSLVAYYFILPRFDLEYEYLYVGGDIDVDVIMAKRKRKTVGSFAKENLEAAAPTGSSHVAPFLKNGKVQDFSSKDPKAKTWTLVYSMEKSTDVVILEIPDTIPQDLRRFAPRKVFFD